VIRLFSTLVAKEDVAISVATGQSSEDCSDVVVSAYVPENSVHKAPESQAGPDAVRVSLESLAWGRSGDKGNKANIGIIAREPEFVPYIAAQLSAARVAQYFEHFLQPGQTRPVERFFLPGSNAFNFLLHNVLGGGGVASLRTDSQGKGYAQLLLTELVSLPRALADRFNLTTV
jgi:hypothetical protein